MVSNFTRDTLILQCCGEHQLIGPQSAAVVFDRLHLRFQLRIKKNLVLILSADHFFPLDEHLKVTPW